MIELRNEFLYATVSSEGGALTSIVDLSDGENLLYALPSAQNDTSDAVLFPFVGRQKNGFYLVGGEKYEIPDGPFAPHSAFTLTSKSDDYAELTLSSDENTLRVYPFDFSLKVRYMLKGKTLSVSYSVYNVGEQKVYFSLGSLPALKTDASGNTLDLHSVGNSAYLLKEGCVISSELIPGVIDLDKTSFAPSSILIERKSDTATIKRACDKTIDVVSDSPIICVRAGDGYAAIGSWWGLPDYEKETERELKNKRFINSLEPKRELKCGYKLEFDNRR
jgi:galactose mutarotase-like enzyme